MRKWLCFILTIFMVWGTVAVSAAEPQPAWGDLNQDSKINAQDALLVLRYAVGKTVLSDAALAVADVDANGKYNANDALLILQYSVDRLERFPADTSGMSEEEIYYTRRDAYYKVDGSDFQPVTVTDPDDAKQVLSQLGKVPQESDIDGYRLNDEYAIIYDRISKEAKAQGTISLYNQAQKVKGSLTLSDGTTLSYEVPNQVTAYSAVPLKYSLKGGKNADRVHVEATTYEDPNRIPQGQKTYYENTLPDNVNVSVTYDGYVQAENVDNSKDPIWYELPAGTVQGSQFLNYEPSDLVRSGTIPTGKETWLKFTFKNTGNTILKGDGMGYFCIRPILYQKDESGDYREIAINDNYAYRLFDPLYPGETKEIYVKFAASYARYATGEYRVALYGELANEQVTPDWAAMYVSGRRVTESVFTFSAAKNAGVTAPSQVETKQVGSITRNGWLGVYEEFQTSFHTHMFVNTEKPETETLYFQPAPWDQTLTLRVISEATGAMNLVTVPLQVETDSISIALNPYNEHYVVKDDGTREPILATQNMADMRGNCQDSPYALETLVNDLKDMEDAGINYLTSTMAFSYDIGKGTSATNACRFMMDCANVMGFAFEGYGMYPFENSFSKSNITRRYANVTASKGNNKVNGILNNWIYERFGNMFWANSKGVTPIAQEDSRGWLTIDHDWRMDLSDKTITKLQNWLQEAYGSIDKLNDAYGSEYSSFNEIDPREEGIEDSGFYNFTKVGSLTNIYHERSQAIKDLDLFRTVNRIQDYREALSVTTVPGAKMTARFESSPLITAGLKADTKNAHYRETYYQMYRAGMVGDLLAASDEVYAASTYQNTPYTAAETYELTKHAKQAGLSVMNYHMHYREQIYNTEFGDSKAVTNLHLADREMKVTSINTASALFPALKATYEAGGIPAVMWMDYYCNGFITSTAYKELRFYSQKIQEMLATEEGARWAKDFDAAGSKVNQNAGHVWSYDEEYCKQAIQNTARRDKFNLNR